MIAVAYLAPEQATPPPPPPSAVGTPGVPDEVTAGSPTQSTAQGTGQSPTETTPASPATLAATSRTPFDVAGVRFAVFVDPSEAWTASARSVALGAGVRWELIAVW
ncbi:MAG TPA: hypothetical protein VG165_10850, partial [Solirubrobacteraceae bacterium]|nr:hypothetical protein [Solirubrobacteraceae bacterium]